MLEHNLTTIEELVQFKKNNEAEEVIIPELKEGRDLRPKNREYLRKQKKRAQILKFFEDDVVPYKTVTGKEKYIKLKNKYAGKIKNLRDRLRRRHRSA